MTNLYRILILLTMLASFTGCGTTSVKDKASRESDKIQSELAKLSADEKIRYAENLFNSALRKDINQRNSTNINVLKILTDVMDDSSRDNEQYTRAELLANQILPQITVELLTPEQLNQYILSAVTLALSEQNIQQAMEFFKLPFSSEQTSQWIDYHRLHAQMLFENNQPAAAVRELIIRQGLLSSLVDIHTNQQLIWNYLARISNKKLETLLLSESHTTNRAMNGWLQLAQIFRTNHEPDRLNSALVFWQQKFPGHQASQVFIEEIITQREKSIIQPSQIAILLPLQGKLAKPARPIIEGILASHYSKPLAADIQLRFYDSSNTANLRMTYHQAVVNGADVVIGPLAKPAVKELIGSGELTIPTLALNNVMDSDNDTTTRNLFQFGLSPEAEAQVVAQKAWRQGHFYAALLIPDNSWGKRMQQAFTRAWEELGGIVVASQEFPATAQDFSTSIKTLLNLDQSNKRKVQLSSKIGKKLEFTPRRRQDIDMIFMAAFPNQARQIPLQIFYHHGETIPVFATSHIVSDYLSSKQNLDLDGVYFVDMPWLIGLNADAISHQGQYNNTLFQRLFALGVDSYQLAPYVKYLENNPSESFIGETGELKIGYQGIISRILPWAVFDKGVVKAGPQNNAEIY